ncbi:hypothetical protein [Sphingomonas rubra]|uniref:NAD dependent epimerase/dehydratase family protein n=1 Tax=Sphingomonas rubra TaxID=634430 RepID=A0A1I5PQ98_9SPHN|nr:hypothetical protein [Sphingomonas rubra]SFP35726.1 hypothetical protein SAMN04488241_101133 [Sphingomonas rubra]
MNEAVTTGPGHAIVLGAEGRVGGAFARRLALHGYRVSRDPRRPEALARAMPGTLLLDCAYRDGEAEEHVWRVEAHLASWRDYAGIFVPSSYWIEGDGGYARAKRRVEQLAASYRALGANVVTDRIGYFPGDGVEPDANEPMIAHLVDGDTLYARVMAQLTCGLRRDAAETVAVG